jgi:glycosyltransferase involved in cell wall biosynthesis
MKTKSGLSIIIPLWNEEKTIPRLINIISESSKLKNFTYIFVNDGSTDNSGIILSTELASVTFEFEIITLEKNSGKASAVSIALPRISTSHFAILDADLELNPEDIFRMWEVVLRTKSQAVFGYREFRSHSSFTYRYTIGNRLISNWFGIHYNVVHTDIMCGLKLLPTNLFQQSHFRLKGFALEIEIPIILWKQNVRIYEIPVEYFPRGWDQGKVIGIKDAIYIILAIPFRRIFLDRKCKVVKTIEEHSNSSLGQS